MAVHADSHLASELRAAGQDLAAEEELPDPMAGLPARIRAI